jgi:orotate phosphoribosyltransferase
MPAMQKELLDLLAARKGHFRLESNHHGDLWLDLELLCVRPRAVQRFAAELAQQLVRHNLDAVCGPLVEGAFVALMVAAELNVGFFYSERFAKPQSDALYAVDYRIPSAQRGQVQGKRVAIVNDIINAGSAVRGTFRDLEACDAKPVAIGALLILGSAATSFASEKHMTLETIASLPNRVWAPQECPLCAVGVPLEDPSPW